MGCSPTKKIVETSVEKGSEARKRSVKEFPVSKVEPNESTAAKSPNDSVINGLNPKYKYKLSRKE